jgi:hypothetical protein
MNRKKTRNAGLFVPEALFQPQKFCICAGRRAPGLLQ